MEKSLGDLLKSVVPEPPKKQKALTAIEQKRFETTLNVALDPTKIQDAMFQHSIFCQTYLPYRNPGDQVTLWEQKQGSASLAIQTMRQKDPRTGEWVQIGVPYGTRSRLILTYVNTQAIKTQSQVVNVEDHLAGFVRKLGLTKTGRTMDEIKEQVRRITASVITLGFQEGNAYVPINFGIVKSFDLWFPKDDRQKILWPSNICLTDDYFNSLVKHAIPLNEQAIGALANNAMAMDIYTWLAQRLHRIPFGENQFVSWQQLKEQFGQGYGRMDNFKAAFRDNLRLSISQYFEARNSVQEVDNKGFHLRNAAPPISKKIYSVPDTLEINSNQSNGVPKLISS